MSQVDADIAFIGPGFDMHGRGDLAGVAVQKFEAGIQDFGQQPLHVRADAQSEAGRLLAMLRQSPLHKDYGDTLDNLTAAGPAHVTSICCNRCTTMKAVAICRGRLTWPA